MKKPQKHNRLGVLGAVDMTNWRDPIRSRSKGKRPPRYGLCLIYRVGVTPLGEEFVVHWRPDDNVPRGSLEPWVDNDGNRKHAYFDFINNFLEQEKLQKTKKPS